eukprot:PhF_6_TR8350/c0_g1_i3/m.13089/K20093/ERCC6L, PICH; DNA excision repair protein ERCC-6-like
MESIIREESHWREYALGKEHRRRLRILQEWQECTGGMRAGEAKKQPQQISPSDGMDASSTHPTPPSTETSRLPIPPDLESKLFQHQIEGIQWLHGVMTAPGSTAQGCILADEMGLGKTIQCSTYIGATLRRKMFRNVLIVVPPTLISNWVEELEKWALLGKEKIITIRCETRKERAMLKKPKVCLQGTVVVTSYGIIVSDVDKWIENGVTFDLVVLDEGHTIKNPATKTTQACRKIPSRKRLLMTGTPVMNNLQELHALFHFVDSEILSCSVAAFSRQVSAPITEGMLRDASDNDVLSANQRLVLLREKIAPYFLRRTKSTEADAASTNNVEEQQHGDEAGEDEEENEEGGTITREISSVSDKGAVTATPAKETNNKLHCVAKQENVVWIPLTEKQQALYLAFLEKPEVQIAMTLISTQKSVLCWLSSLKKLCDHTWLHMPTSEFQDQADNIGGRMSVIPAPPPSNPKSISNEQQTLDDTVVVEDLEDAENADEDDVIMRNTIGEVVFSFGTIWEGSRKIEVAIKLLELHVQEKGEKCLVFSRSLRLLDILSWAIQSRFGVTAMRIDGSVKPSERQGLVKIFNEDPSHRICLLTTVVGGLGLTMVGANCVILMDPSWNPAVDAQAVDRVHRVGQTKDVNVYRLITCGTVEEKMYRRQIFKSVLAKRSSSATKENSHISSHFTKTELRDMFKLENTKNSNTHVQLVSLLGSHIAVDPTAHPLSEDFEMTIHSAVLSSDYASRVQPKVESTPAKRIRATRKEKATPSSVLSDLNADMNPETPSTSQRIKANHDEDDERPMGWMVGTTPQTATKQKKQTRRKEKGDDTTTQKKLHRGDKPEEGGDAEAVDRGEDNLDDLILRGMSLSINDKENTQPMHPTSSASKAAPAEKRRSTSPVSQQDTLLPVTQPTPTKGLKDPIPVVHVQGPASLSNSSTCAHNDGFSGIRWVF